MLKLEGLIAEPTTADLKGSVNLFYVALEITEYCKRQGHKVWLLSKRVFAKQHLRRAYIYFLPVSSDSHLLSLLRKKIGFYNLFCKISIGTEEQNACYSVP